AESTAAKGDEHRIDVWHVLDDLEPDGAVAGHDVHIADWLNEARRLQWLVATRGKHVPPFGVGQGDEFRAEALDRRELCAPREMRAFEADERCSGHRACDAVARRVHIVERDRGRLSLRPHQAGAMSDHSSCCRSSRFMIFPLGLTGIASSGTNAILLGTL